MQAFTFVNWNLGLQLSLPMILYIDLQIQSIVKR